MQTLLRRLLAAIVFALLSLLTVAAQEVTVDSLRYTLYTAGHTAKVTGYVDGIRNAKIVKTISWNGDEYKVTSIKEECFHDCRTLQSIEIPDGISEIPERCFWGCFGLSSVTLPKSVTTLSDWCFSDCTSLKKITLPEFILTIGDGCFRYSAINEITCLAIDPPSCSVGAFDDINISNCTVYVNDVDAYKKAKVSHFPFYAAFPNDVISLIADNQ